MSRIAYDIHARFAGGRPLAAEEETSAVALPVRVSGRDGFAGADAQAYNEMVFGSKGQQLRWKQVPELVVLMSVMQYQRGATHTYVATSERLTDAEANQLVDDLTSALGLMTGGALTAFSAVRREFVDASDAAEVLRPGTIVVGRFQGVEDAMHTIGLGGRTVQASGTITGGAILLDAEYDRTSEKRRLLRTHELGHALGFRHVQSRASIMNPRIGSDLTEFDRQVATISFLGFSSTGPHPSHTTSSK